MHANVLKTQQGALKMTAMERNMKQRLVFAISGASGMPLARAMLESYASLPNLEIHLIISANAEKAMKAEGGLKKTDFEKLAHRAWQADNMAAAPASGSWLHAGMIICPCSMATLAAIATGCGTNLTHRAADACLKERRPLILVARESPLGLVHLRNMMTACEAGAVIMPFAPAFYTADCSMNGAFRQFAGRALDILKLPHQLCERWEGLQD